MSYLTREMTVSALANMRGFHRDIVNTYQKYDMDLLDNLGRRNIVMSQAQEKFFAEALSSKYSGVTNDGKTGQPDIILEELNKELECKLTSRHKGGAISLQSDFGTLSQKGELDYLYVIADNAFERFCVLHFTDLTTDDFRPLSTGSRGKVSMYKHKAMAKCNVLLGNAVNLNELELAKLHDKLNSPVISLSDTARKRLLKRVEYWQDTPAKYSYELEEVSCE